MRDEGMEHLLVVGMAEQSGRLIQEQEVFVFIQDVQHWLLDF